VDVIWDGEIIEWRGPSPFHFVVMPDDESAELRRMVSELSYGWGCIPVVARLGDTEWRTSLMPRQGRYLVPIKDAVRRAEDVELGDDVTVGIRLAPKHR
jgi:Domain of unknown function (DUF1905)